MGLLTNKIKVLLQRVKMAGREPQRIVIPQGLKDALRMEMDSLTPYVSTWDRYNMPVNELEAKIQKSNVDMVFEGIPVFVDNSLKDIGEDNILIQVKPRPYGEDEPVPDVDWSKVLKVKRL